MAHPLFLQKGCSKKILKKNPPISRQICIFIRIPFIQNSKNHRCYSIYTNDPQFKELASMASIPGFSQSVIVKTPSLLPMQYRAREIEEELGVSSLTIRGWIKKGLPVSRDSRGHLWINGQALSAWIKSRKSKRSKPGMKPGEAFCLCCRKVVLMADPEVRVVRGKQAIMSGLCPDCGGKINRGMRADG
jgi:hypothetical protein